ncbi:MAG: DedA family protein [Proteobacteria bacterium]|nr:DedA family protein [Pseudomonadota bacterium]
MEQARIFLTHYSGTEGYVIFYFILIGCGIGMPFNSDITIITASVLAALGLFKLPILMPIAFAGLLTGDTINFFVARKYGPKLLTKAPFRWFLTPEKVKSAEAFLAEKGSGFLFCVRFLPLIRTALFFTAGSLQVKPRTFYLLNISATVIYLSVLMNLAHSAGENIEALLPVLKRFQLALLGLFTVGLTAFFIKRRKTAAS